MPGTAPRMRPRRPSDAEPGQGPSGEGLFEAPVDPETAGPAPSDPVGPPPARPAASARGAAGLPTRDGGARGAGTNGHGTNGTGTNGTGTNGTGTNGTGTNGTGTNGTVGGLPTRPGGAGSSGTPSRPAPGRVPLRSSSPTREKTPIFDEVASVWFREAPPSTPADDDAAWATTGDAGWRAAAAASEVTPESTTEAGLPRRRPRARLVPGGADDAERPGRPAATGGAAAIGSTTGSTPADPAPAGPTGAASPTTGPARRDAEAIRGRLASYQQGVSDGRTSRRTRGPDTGGDDARGRRPGDEEEQ